MISALLLAAGSSLRMKGANKLLLPVGGKPCVRVVAEAILAADMGETFVVTGHEAERVRAALEGLPVQFIHNGDHRSGMTGSIQKGVSIARGNGYLICLSDMPFITAAEYRRLTEGFRQLKTNSFAPVCVPAHGGRPGNPVLFDAAYRDELLAHTGPEGCRGLLQRHAGCVSRIGMPTDGILRDIDTADDYSLLAKGNAAT